MSTSALTPRHCFGIDPEALLREVDLLMDAYGRMLPNAASPERGPDATLLPGPAQELLDSLTRGVNLRGYSPD